MISIIVSAFFPPCRSNNGSFTSRSMLNTSDQVSSFAAKKLFDQSDDSD